MWKASFELHKGIISYGSKTSKYTVSAITFIKEAEVVGLKLTPAFCWQGNSLRLE